MTLHAESVLIISVWFGYTSLNTFRFFAAQQHLNGIRLYGQEIKVSKSKHDSVNMPKNEEEVSCLSCFQYQRSIYALEGEALVDIDCIGAIRIVTGGKQ